MNLLITGASGFLGDYVVTEALRCGHQVRAVVRPCSNLQEKLSRFAWGCDRPPETGLSPVEMGRNDPGHPTVARTTAGNVEIACIDLKTGDGLTAALQDIDAVIHLAAAKTGDYSTQFANTVTATQTLLTAMERAGVSRLVSISSFSVYDYLHQPEGALLDENAPLERRAAYRDVYAQTKLQQEQLVRDFQARSGTAVTILRPGIIFGREALWPAHLGAQLMGNLYLQIGRTARLPLTYVENCAEAVVQAVESDDAIGQIVNVIDDDRPTQQEYIDCLRHHQAQSFTHQSQPPTSIKVSWKAMRSMARCAWTIDRLLGQRLPLPGILVPARLHARFKPLAYSNYAAKALLHWAPRYSLPEAISRSLLDLNRHHLPTSKSHSSSPTASNSSSMSSSPNPESVTITAS